MVWLADLKGDHFDEDKINKKLVLFTSILILLPCLVGCVFWNQLPEEIPTHFNLLGQADGYNHKMSAIFELPTLMLLMHWLLLLYND